MSVHRSLVALAGLVVVTSQFVFAQEALPNRRRLKVSAEQKIADEISDLEASRDAELARIDRNLAALSGVRDASAERSNLYSERSRVYSDYSRQISSRRSAMVSLQVGWQFRVRGMTVTTSVGDTPIESWVVRYRSTPSGIETDPPENPALLRARAKRYAEDYADFKKGLKASHLADMENYRKVADREMASIAEKIQRFRSGQDDLLMAEPEPVLRKRAGAPYLELCKKIDGKVEDLKKVLEKELERRRVDFLPEHEKLLVILEKEAATPDEIKAELKHLKKLQSGDGKAMSFQAAWTALLSAKSDREQGIFTMIDSFEGVAPRLAAERKAFAPFAEIKRAIRQEQSEDVAALGKKYLEWYTSLDSDLKAWRETSAKTLQSEEYAHVREGVAKRLREEEARRLAFGQTASRDIATETSRQAKLIEEIFTEIDSDYEGKVEPETSRKAAVEKLKADLPKRPSVYERLSKAWADGDKGEKSLRAAFPGVATLVERERKRYPIRITPDSCDGFLYEMKLHDAVTTLAQVKERAERVLLRMYGKRSFACQGGTALLVAERVELKDAQIDKADAALAEQIKKARESNGDGWAVRIDGDKLVAISEVPEAGLRFHKLMVVEKTFWLFFRDPDGEWIDDFAWSMRAGAAGFSAATPRLSAEQVAAAKEIWDQ